MPADGRCSWSWPSIRFPSRRLSTWRRYQRNPFRERSVIGRVQQTPRGLSLLPYSLHPAKGEATHLALDTVASGAAKPPAGQAAEEDEAFEAPEENESGIALSPVFSRLLNDIDDLLLSLAESGMAGLNPLRIQRIEQVAPRVERIHLRSLATSLKNVIAKPQASTVLRCCYLNQLHRLGGG